VKAGVRIGSTYVGLNPDIVGKLETFRTDETYRNGQKYVSVQSK